MILVIDTSLSTVISQVFESIVLNTKSSETKSPSILLDVLII